MEEYRTGKDKNECAQSLWDSHVSAGRLMDYIKMGRNLSPCEIGVLYGTAQKTEFEHTLSESWKFEIVLRYALMRMNAPRILASMLCMSHCDALRCESEARFAKHLTNGGTSARCRIKR